MPKKTEENILKVDKTILSGIIISLIRGYAFNHSNMKPDKIVLPYVSMVDGIPVEYEQEVKDGSTNN